MNPRERSPRPGITLDVRRELDLKGRGSKVDFGGIPETVITRTDFSMEESRRELRGINLWVFAYGIQGQAQAQNLRDNGFPVRVWQREHYSKPGEEPTRWEVALEDDWQVGKNLYPDLKTVESVMAADRKPKLVLALLSDAGFVSVGKDVIKLLKPGDNLQFSHGFYPTFAYLTGAVFPPSIDVTLMAPKGPGGMVREHYKHGRGVNASIAAAQNFSRRALERTLASGMGTGAGILFPTTFERETWSDNVGENGSLIAGVDGLIKTGFSIFTEDLGFSPEEAVWHTSEIITQTVSKIIGEKGADGLVNDLPRHLLSYFASGFDAAYIALDPVLKDLYHDVSTGVIARRVIEANSKSDYRDTLNQELDDIRNSKLGQAATDVRLKREQKGRVVPSSIENPYDALIAGALVGLMQRQYELLREKGHSPDEAFNETTEEATQSLYPYIDKNGIYELYKGCSTTAQRGALDHNEVFRKALMSPLRGLYIRIRREESLELSLGAISHILNSEMWKAGKATRDLRPENQKIA